MTERDVDFGFETVSPSEKTQRVHGVFEAVADRYDTMNDLMSLGLHRVFKRVAIEMTSLRRGGKALDLAGGTGDIARLLADVVGPDGDVVLADINDAMLRVGRDRLIDAGYVNVRHALANGECLPFADDSFNAVTIGFGLRNMTDKDAALRETHRVLRPAGVLIVLEFSRPPQKLLRDAFGLFQRTWPLAGRFVVGDPAPYRYLVESIEMHPDQDALELMIADAGFNDTRYENLMGGVVAIHRGQK